MSDQKIWRSSAPSNIALIKYMGKIDSLGNHPCNSSLSYTLGHLQSYVELRLTDRLNGNSRELDTWLPLERDSLQYFDDALSPSFTIPELSQQAQTRFLQHLKFVKDSFQFRGGFEVRSANGFPADCGLASSASSFAALTICASQALTELTGRKKYSQSEISEMSRHGSGSSCRSLFSPWSIWNIEGAKPVDLGYKKLIHQVVVVDSSKKKVSSSEAHKRVVSSPLFERRRERAESRLKELITALRGRNWAASYQLMWGEFWDMQGLFETSKPSFGYLSADSMHVLRWLQMNTWEANCDGPLITMDAGPNVHLLYREDQRDLAEKVQREFTPMMNVLSSYDFETYQQSSRKSTL